MAGHISDDDLVGLIVTLAIQGMPDVFGGDATLLTAVITGWERERIEAAFEVAMQKGIIYETLPENLEQQIDAVLNRAEKTREPWYVRAWRYLRNFAPK